MSDASLSHGETHVEEEENYFISMTDMMVGVLFIFIILLMVFAANFRQQTETSEDQIKKLKQAAEVARKVAEDLGDLRKRVNSEIATLSESDQVRTRLLQEISAELQRRDKDFRVTIDPASGVVRLGENAVRFEFGSEVLTPTATRRVDTLGSVLSDVLPKYTVRDGAEGTWIETVFIEGHTDPKGDDANNWDLSTGRAVNTFRRLATFEPALRNLRNDKGTEILSVAGYGSTRQIEGVSDDSQRRIDMRFVMSTNSMERLRDVLGLTDTMEERLQDLRKKLDDVGAN